MSGDETPPCNPTEIAAALCASQRREERLCVTDHVKECTNRVDEYNDRKLRLAWSDVSGEPGFHVCKHLLTLWLIEDFVVEALIELQRLVLRAYPFI